MFSTRDRCYAPDWHFRWLESYYWGRTRAAHSFTRLGRQVNNSLTSIVFLITETTKLRR